ncbi:SDR family oxidoreductase [Rummeliibacillus pycnus]|uniref:SDR family oxidoreductase n=1 Tax=Rummeliibacillus pycnus TaxID=101070 RepID=UPI003D2E421D
MKKVVLVTGSTRGIGRSIAKHLSNSDYYVMVNGTNQKLIDEVVSDIHADGGKAAGYCANIADPSDVDALVAFTIETFGQIDVLIHNAGNLADQKCIGMTDEQWRSVIDVHLNGAFYCIRRVLPYLKEHGGDIILMTSTAGLMGSVGQVNYSAAKAGLLGMLFTLASELKRYCIRVNAVSPAALTDMTRPVIEHLTEKYAKRNEPFPDFWKVGKADDIAFFIGELLNYKDEDLTGEIFGVNGTKITRWQKPIVTMSADSPEAFFSTYEAQKGSE